MKTYKDSRVNSVNGIAVVPSNPAAELTDYAATCVRNAVRRAIRLSVQADTLAIGNAADEAVRLALASMGIVG